MNKEEKFNTFWDENHEELEALIAAVKKEIDDDCRAYSEDTYPGILLTISIDEDCTDFHYQTGDNSFTGPCYMHSYWSVTAIYKDSFPANIAEYLIEELTNVYLS